MNEIHKVTVNGYGVKVDAAPTQDSPNAVSSGGVYDTVFADSNTVGGTWTFAGLGLQNAGGLHAQPTEGGLGFYKENFYGSSVMLRGRNMCLSLANNWGNTLRRLAFDATSYYGSMTVVGVLEEAKVDQSTTFNQVNVGRTTQKLLVRGQTITLQAGEKTLLLDEDKLQKLDNLLNQ